MKKIKGIGFIIFALLFLSTANINAQGRYNIKYQEVGGWIGAANYYGDLNTLFGFKGTRPALGAYFRQTFTPYISLKLGASYGMIEFKDVYTNLPWQEVRNLSFRNNIIELSGSFEFNFLKYIPKDRNFPFTPYLSLGIAVFKHNPKAKYDGQWYKLKDIGTEGQLSDHYDVKEYKTIQPAFPVGMGIKYWMKGKWTFSAEVGYRFTFTDYIDDVHGTYINSNNFGGDLVASILADPSQLTLDDPLSQPTEGAQRGDSISNDSYLFFGLSVSYAIFKVKCP